MNNINQYCHKLFPTVRVGFGACCLLFIQIGSAQSNDVYSYKLLFENGDSISATNIKSSENHPDFITIESQHLLEPSELSIAKLKTIELNLPSIPRESPLPEHLATIDIRSKNLNLGPKRQVETESLSGQIIALNSDWVTLKTNFSSEISVHRSKIHQIEVEDQTSIVYQKPDSLNGWSILGSDKANHPSWSVQHYEISSNFSQGEISKDVGLPDLSHISFDLEHQTTRRFYLYFYASENKNDGGKSDNYYQFVTQTGNHFIQRVTDGRIYPLNRKIDHNTFRRNDTSDKKLSYDLYLDRKNGHFHIYLDDTYYRSFSDTKPPHDKLGTSIHLVSMSAPHTLSNFKISRWNGALDASNNQDAGDDMIKSNDIRLTNNDTLNGSVDKIENEVISINSEFGALALPLHRVKKIYTPSVNALEKLKLTRNHIRAKFPDKRSLILKLDSINGTSMNAEHRLYGSKTYDLKAFSSIEFNIH